ncbi:MULTISPECIES: helix-turn-helix transcriptional regulator [Bacillus]|uniref:helix-turn-helix transcriptional regulator n=1 Tax=Bacillus TaxID=1386 RepID=UPI0011A7C5B0|nr:MULTISPECIES: helix-turn-helix transcriptional regulator [Bacillus]MBU8728351.1 helix-turn-helix transcriptional regulator [Bacillus pumilus]MCP1149883.1 helix-turn-helix transcriptional regulator [Bacillus sp. 1735sda2]QHQ75094.1 helix-turn-helix domain-containing protein [Bacillus pumilus]TYS31801.1 helix-turn-helix transcriptional regulator [Bacillus pumilus]TYS47439.1 helix-turn-helix transcriptional regulator [Bacillus pumilus]
MNKKLIGEKLLLLRNKRPRAIIATAIGISESALAMYESGNRTPRDEIKIKIAAFYNKTVQEIFFD